MRPSSDRRLRPWLAALLLAAPGLAGSAPEAAAQIVYPGDVRVEMSDVTGPPLTSGDLFGPGTVRSFTCPVAWGVRTVADRTSASLSAGEGPPILATAGKGSRLSQQTRDDLRAVLSDGEGDDAASQRLIAALAAAPNAPGAAAPAKGLVERLNGLLSNATRLRPARPGHRTATQLASAVGAYNRFIERSSSSFLAAPPDALLGVQAVLSPLVVAALENQGREADERAATDALACAAPAPAPTAPTPPALPVERPVVVCVLAADGLRAIGAIVLASGDTVVASAGRRVPIATAYPPAIPYAADAPWYASAEAIELNGRRYVRYGLPRLAAPDAELRPVGAYRGIPLFAATDADAVVVPLDRGCLVQDYRPELDLRPRG